MVISSAPLNKVLSNESDSHINWKERMQAWRKMLTSKGTITNFKVKRKEIFESATTSIMAIL